LEEILHAFSAKVIDQYLEKRGLGKKRNLKEKKRDLIVRAVQV